MKTRNGFVSNSSSSSFVVVFSHKPKTEQEVFEILYGKEFDPSTNISIYPENGNVVLASQVAGQVFKDLKGQRKAGVKKIAEELQVRYHWCNSHNCMSWDGNGFVSNYGWGPTEQEMYFGSDKASMDKIASLCMERDLMSKRHQQEIEDWLAERGLTFVAYGRTDEDRKAYGIYSKKRNKLLNTEGQDIRQKHFKESDKNWRAEDKYRRKAGLADAKDLMAKNDDKFMAVFSYGDDDGSFFSTIEHGSTFDKLSHIRISHH